MEQAIYWLGLTKEQVPNNSALVDEFLLSLPGIERERMSL